MAKAWSDKTEFGKFIFEIAKSQGRDFESLILPLLRVIWPATGHAPALGWIDNSGVDLMVWSNQQPYPLVVQCKGFKVPEERVGYSQVKQCLRSIAKFRASGLQAQTYLLIHNRTGRNARLRSQVGDALQELVESGQVLHAELWDSHKFLTEVFNAAREIIRSQLDRRRSTVSLEYGDRQICEPLAQVPYQQSELVANPYQLVRNTNPVFYLADPISELLNASYENLFLIIGEAGYGKTTAILRALAATNHQVFYIAASTLPRNVNSLTQLLSSWVKVDDLFDEPPNSDLESFTRLFNVVIKDIFKESRLPVLLMIDGLDESIYFSRRGGLQALFNQLRRIRVSTVLTARKEYWLQREQDFAQSIGKTRSGEQPYARIRKIELLEWSAEQIGELAERYRETLTSSTSQKHLDEFIAIVKARQYESYYGDIPKRPLFLRFILETVSEHGVHQTGRAKLYYEWAQLKINRDISHPMKGGQEGRLPILSGYESQDTTMRMSFLAMMLASFKMTVVIDQMVELLPDCALNEILIADERLKSIIDPTGLFLSSLLLSLPTPPHEPIRVYFGHRTYQEFFLALYIRTNPQEFKDKILPVEITEHLADIEREGL